MFRKIFVKSLKDVTFTRFFYILKPKNMETLNKKKAMLHWKMFK